MNLKSAAARGVKWTTLSTIAVTLTQLAQLSVLARFLTPDDFGVMAIMMVVIGFLQAFTDMGISNAIIHRQDVSHSQLSSLYWVNIAAGLAMFALTALLSPVVAVFYAQPRIVSLLLPLSLVFVLVAVGDQYRVLCQKDLQFSRIAKIETIAALGSFLIAVPMATKGYGAHSLVMATLVNAGVSSALFIITGLRWHYRPALVYRHSELKGFYAFGLFQMGEKSINYFNTQFDIILIGRLLGAESTGIYHIAKTLAMRLVSAINPIVVRVILPLMARFQDDPQAIKKIYLKIISYLAVVTFPAFAALAVLAEPLILLLFGPQWIDAVPILQILSIYMLVRSTGNPVGSLLLARGRAGLGFCWNLGLFVMIPVIVVLGSYWGTTGVAVALLLMSLALLLPSWYYLVRPLCGAGVSEYFASFLKPLLWTCGAVAVALPFTAVDGLISRVVAVVLVGTSVYVILLLRHGGDFVQVLREHLPVRWKPEP